ncbi:hypothetical protein BH23PAT2_BH23PAT2_09370 [soil metagenome]
MKKTDGEYKKMNDTTTRQPGTDRTRNTTGRHIVVGILIFASGLLFGIGFDGSSLSNRFNQTANTDLPTSLDYSSVDEVYNSLRDKYDGDLNTDMLLDGLKQGLARATGDPYTEYLNAEESQGFEDDLNGSFSGIGAELARQDDAIVVVAPISGFPAEEAGLRPQDIILQIDGESAQGLSTTEAVNKIRGPVGTDVQLTVFRGTERVEVTITRATITIASAEYEILEGNIGYLKISRFGNDTVGIASKAANDFASAGVSGVVLDLRSNPGGLLNGSVEISSLWLPRGTMVLEERRGDEVIRTFEANGSSILEGIETVVLINEGSASASEIVAGALRDNNAATLFGMNSFGKGSVQQLDNLRSGGTLKVTIARWFTPNGENIDKEGIAPDTEVEMTEEDYINDRDPQRDAAVESLKQ